MSLSRFFRQLALFAITLVVPIASSAATITQVIKTQDGAIVTRGEFLQASINLLGLPLDKGTTTKNTYKRPVTRANIPYVRTGETRDALAIFGSDLGLGKGITRGEALVILMKLQNIKPLGKAVTFSDVKGADLVNATALAVEKGWMKPARSNFFGVATQLTGLEAKALLKKATGAREENVELGSHNNRKVQSTTIKIKPKEVKQLPESDLLNAVWQLLNQQYLYNDKLDDKEAAYRAAEGLVNSLNDPYTTFMRPIDSRQFQETIGGEISGIGAQVEYQNNTLVIVAPLSGSPAQKAGIKPGDVITAVNGESLAGLNLVKAVEKVRGPKGTAVTLTIMRDGNPIDIQVTRDTVRMPEIDISFQNGIAVVKLVQFGQTTERELRGLLEKVQLDNPSGIILDLRNNPGGLLHAAEIVLSNFLPKGSAVASIRAKNEEYIESTVDAPTIKSDVDMVVLVNKGSASASEIVAGALQDHKRATILGEKTFGKGTVQQIVEFRDGSSMKMTIAEWFTPKGRQINKLGLDPDVTVTMTEGRDEQMLRAIDLLR